ncbi:MAG: sensor histidine kinase [Actinomycetota bacterium]|nr:sensor histidine kinase [Actinomycetota bacterium]
MANSQESGKRSLAIIGAAIGLAISILIIVYSYDYAISADPRIIGFWFYLTQKPYRLLQLSVSLFPIGIGYFVGKEHQEKKSLKIVAQENRLLYQQTLEKQEALDQLMHRISRAHEEERKRISRELHDGIAQNLSGIILDVGYLKAVIGEPEAQKHLQELTDLAKETVIDLRRILNDLRPVILDSQGLAPTLGQHVEKFGRETNIEIELKMDLAQRLPPGMEITIFRIVQEALNNVKKYAQAKAVTVAVGLDSDSVGVTIQDDGQGFDLVKGLQDHRGFGLVNMKDRAESIGGTIDVATQPGAGTTIKVTIPLASVGEFDG